MLKTQYIPCQRALSSTGIGIADYVINPYRGCEYGCLYCYSQRNKCFQKRKEKWGTFVDIKKDIVQVLKRELRDNRISRVMLGSTTEVYQPIEAVIKNTRSILECLMLNHIPVTILTKSDMIMRDMDLLKINSDNKICFTINSNEVIHLFEKGSADLDTRLKIINKLNKEGINTYAHIGPVFPYITNVKELLRLCWGKTKRVNIENLNLMMVDREKIIRLISTRFPSLSQKIRTIYYNVTRHLEYWQNTKADIEQENKKYAYKMDIFLHSPDTFF